MADDAVPRSVARRDDEGALKLFVLRLHFYVGLFVGPFILVAALSGVLYVLTPQVEAWLYRDQLQANSSGTAQTLSAQAAAARAFVGEGPRLFAVRPAPAPGMTTQIMFAEPGLGDSESRSIFVDPASLAIQGDLVVYGTSGILPSRTALDYLHRNLLMGEPGRYYSELAASWLWVAALGGVLLWFWRRGAVQPAGPKARKAFATRRLHGLVGVWIAVGLLFLSATGLTWSKWAGDRIDQFRTTVGWVTPSVSVALGKDVAVAPQGEHAHHAAEGHGHTASHSGHAGGHVADPSAQLDRVLAVSRQAGIDSGMLELRPPKTEGQAWLVREYDRQWPTQVDTIAIDPGSMEVTSRADFATFPLVAKLIRWGIDAHMGILFGVANQIFMAGLGIALVVAIVYGYRIWWMRRPAPGAMPRTLARAWTHLSAGTRIGVVVAGAAFGWAMPVMGMSLLVFLAVDLLRYKLSLGKEAGNRAKAPAE
jgi:uncharacterized iron-regulated membrane protein